MVFTNLRNFCQDLESTIHDEIDENIAFGWNEDTITLNIIKNLWKKYQSTLISKPSVLQVNWQPYKLTKKQSMEQKFGDIAIIMNISFQDGTVVKGVGFLEAKKRNLQTRKFDAIKHEQFERILTSAPHALVLLYDHLEIKNFADLGFTNRRTSNPLIRHITSTKSLVSPMNYVYENNLTDEKIYNVSLPFSYQLCFRYFQGFDLEMDPAIYHATISGTKHTSDTMSTEGYPQYLMTFSVSYGDTKHHEPHSINPDFYQKIESTNTNFME